MPSNEYKLKTLKPDDVCLFYLPEGTVKAKVLEITTYSIRMQMLENAPVILGGVHTTYRNGQTLSVLVDEFARGMVNVMPLGPLKPEATKVLVTHDGHEVVGNTVLGKDFKYCRNCKVEV